jgi:hypothetical protein
MEMDPSRERLVPSRSTDKAGRLVSDARSIVHEIGDSRCGIDDDWRGGLIWCVSISRLDPSLSGAAYEMTWFNNQKRCRSC